MADIKTLFKDGGAKPVLCVDPLENIITGMANILRYMNVKSGVTIMRWTEVYGFPAIKRPDGKWMTSMTAVDNWIWTAAEVDAQNRPFSRGDNHRFDIALAVAQRRFDRAQRHKLKTGPVDSFFKPEFFHINDGSENSPTLGTELREPKPE